MNTVENTDMTINARVQLLLNNGFFGNLATRLTLEDASIMCPLPKQMADTSFITKNLLTV